MESAARCQHNGGRGILNSRKPSLLQSIYGRFHVVVLITAASVGAAWWFSGIMEPMYRSQARFFLPEINSGFSLSGEAVNIPSGPRLPTGITETQDSLLGILRSSEFRLQIAAQFADHTSEDFERRVDIQVDKFNMVVVTVWDTAPSTAAEIANAYVRRIRDRLRDSSRNEASRAAGLLENSVASKREELKLAETERLDFLAGRATTGMDSEYLAIASRVSTSQAALDNALALDASVDERVLHLRTKLGDRPEEFRQASFVRTPNPRLDDFRLRLAAAEAELATLKLEARQGWPEFDKQVVRVEGLRQQLNAEEASVEASATFQQDALRDSWLKQLTDLELERERLSAEVEQRQIALAEAKAEWDGLPDVVAKLAEHDRTLGRIQVSLDDLIMRANEAALEAEHDPGFIEQVEVASASLTPDWPDLTLNLAAGALLGLLMGLFVAAALGRTSTWQEQAPW